MPRPGYLIGSEYGTFYNTLSREYTVGCMFEISNSRCCRSWLADRQGYGVSLKSAFPTA